MAITERAPAKLNLTLRILGRRADGYHLLESIVVFAGLHDVITVAPAKGLQLEVGGAFAAEAGTGEENLVLRAARLLKEQTGVAQGAAIQLEKNIPVGAGLGGGSADAAATLRALMRLWDCELPPETLQRLAVTLGADVAMCLESQPILARGIGEVLEPLPWELPELHAVLVYPRVPLLSSDVYRALRATAVTSVEKIPEFSTQAVPRSSRDLIALLRAQGGNGLEAAARQVCPAVTKVLQALRAAVPHSDYIQMTGSGACCFALYEMAEEAKQAAAQISHAHPEWFCRATQLS